MSRYTGPRWKLSRRLGISLLGTGRELQKRPYPPGQHGRNQRRKISEFGTQLQEKQKLRLMYGLTERQFRNLFKRAGKMKGVYGENMMILLERRLDNLVFRLGLAASRAQARQLVVHGHVTVNGRKLNIPSYAVEVNDKISLREKSRKLGVVAEAIENSPQYPEYLTFDKKELAGCLNRLPERSELPSEINEQLIVEFYSR
jgi:small subunit ribosomal protein S4